MIYQDDKLFIELEIAEIPWLKIFTGHIFLALDYAVSVLCVSFIIQIKLIGQA